MDTLDEKPVQRGFAATVHNHIDYEALAAEAARLQKSGKGPIIIIGYSLGADAAIFMAEKMKAAGASVALVVTFGPTMSLKAPSNVSQVVNYYTGSTLVTRGPGFKGRISNLNPNATPSIISKIQMVAGRGHLGRAAVIARRYFVHTVLLFLNLRRGNAERVCELLLA
ncbi:MAG: hypothetical protein WBW99_21165 [Pseudolabrys sp.]